MQVYKNEYTFTESPVAHSMLQIYILSVYPVIYLFISHGNRLFSTSLLSVIHPNFCVPKIFKKRKIIIKKKIAIMLKKKKLFNIFIFFLFYIVI